MYLCYLDESGTDGKSRIVTVVGILVDASRHGRSADVFRKYFQQGAQQAKTGMREFKGSDLYQGKSKWRGVAPEVREGLINDIVGFAEVRRHLLAIAAIDLDRLAVHPSPLGSDLDARDLCALHCLIQIQRHQSRKPGRKGDTLVLLDDHRGNDRLSDLVADPPRLVREFAGDAKSKVPFAAIVESPLSVQSHRFGMTQIADVDAFVLGRHARLASGESEAFTGESQRVGQLVSQLMPRLLPGSQVLPKRGGGALASWFREVTPMSVQTLFG